MPNPIKYSTGSETLALKKGNFYIGTGDVGKGPTNVTGYYNGITPPSGGYTIYLNKETSGPSIYTVSTEAQLTGLTSTIAGQSLTTSGACLNWFATQTDKMIFNIDYPAIVTNGLVLNVDAAFTPSYSQSGVTWYDVSSSGNNGTLTNGPTFNSSNYGSIVFDGIDDYVNFGSPSTLDFGTNNFNLSCWVNIPSTSGSDWMGIISRYLSGNGFWIQLDSSNRYVAFGWDCCNYITSSTSCGGGQWKFISCQRIGSTSAEVYVNGSLVASSSSLPSKTTNDGPIYIGGLINFNRYTSGNISQVTMYNRALTTAEIIQNYEAIGTRYITLQVQSLVVAGGGGSPGNYAAGGGGAGGLLTGTTTSLSTNTNYSITVGAGGGGSSNGSNSVFNLSTAIGGGIGGQYGGSDAGNGGSGGGGRGSWPGNGGLYYTPKGLGTAGQGNDGGRGAGGAGYMGGGGGGAGNAGNDAAANTGGNGGAGSYFSEYTSLGGSPAGWFAGGGGGAADPGSAGSGGNGGGGAASYVGNNGVINTGGGAGAASGPSSGRQGGSGIIILRIPDVYTARFSSGVSASVTKSGGYKYYKVTATSTTSETVSFS